MKPIVLALLGFGLLGLESCSVRAAGDEVDAPPAPRSEDVVSDPPSRAARLAWFQGQASFREGGAQTWTPALLNRPFTAGDSLATAGQSRAELSVGDAAFRLDEQTNVTLLRLDDGQLWIRLNSGVLQVQVRAFGESNGMLEIRTPAVTANLLRPGYYRFDVNADSGATRAVVRGSGGIAELLPGQGRGQPIVVRGPEEVWIPGMAEAADPIHRAAPRRMDDFDLFCEGREKHAIDTSVDARRNLPSGMVGWEDLDEYGVWTIDPEYGSMWAPSTVAAGWAPYRFGRWLWIEPWGWTWVDDAPWGFAPFHYGRWIQIRLRWWWIPGPRLHRACFSPALVEFVGSGGGGLFGGWFPLGPREVYVPPYRASRNYVARINSGHVHDRDLRDLNRIRPHRNQTIPEGVTRTRDGDFHGGKPVTVPRTGKQHQQRRDVRGQQPSKSPGSKRPAPKAKE